MKISRQQSPNVQHLLWSSWASIGAESDVHHVTSLILSWYHATTMNLGLKEWPASIMPFQLLHLVETTLHYVCKIMQHDPGMSLLVPDQNQ